MRGERHVAPATPGDLLFHIRASTMDRCFELAARITTMLAGAVTVADEVHGFQYFDNRDLLGFVDGTENPDGRKPPRPLWSAPRTRISSAAATYTCRSTYTTWPPGALFPSTSKRR